MKICRLCQHENPDGSQFCATCGNNLSGDLLTPPVSAPASPVSPVPPAVPAPVSSQTPAQPLSQPQPVSSMIPQSPVQNSNPGPQSPYQSPSGQLPPQGQYTRTSVYGSQQGPYSQQFESPNTIPFNERDRQEYARRMADTGRQDYESVCVLAFVFGLVGFLFNPLYLISLAAIILGVVGHSNNGSKKTLGMLGWILGIISLFVQMVFDYLCAVSTCGIGAISIFF